MDMARLDETLMVWDHASSPTMYLSMKSLRWHRHRWLSNAVAEVCETWGTLDEISEMPKAAPSLPPFSIAYARTVAVSETETISLSEANYRHILSHIAWCWADAKTYGYNGVRAIEDALFVSRANAL